MTTRFEVDRIAKVAFDIAGSAAGSCAPSIRRMSWM